MAAESIAHRFVVPGEPDRDAVVAPEPGEPVVAVVDVVVDRAIGTDAGYAAALEPKHVDLRDRCGIVPSAWLLTRLR